jgi:hypothetical protein
MRKALRALYILFGATDIVIALVHLALGPASIPGSVPVNATMDSEDRFYATLFLAFGVAILWCAKDVERRSNVAYFLLGTFFVGGLARLVSIAAVGRPNALFMLLTGVELTLPLLLAWLQRQVTSRAH